MQWELATNIILVASFAVLAVFALTGLVQLFKRKSFKKVDRELTAFTPPLVLMAAIYFVFDKIWVINTRPHTDEPSFPSTHAMVVATIFFITMLALPKYIKNKPLRLVLDFIMLALIVIVCIGRVAAELHWTTDVVCGVVFAGILAVIYYLFSHPKKGAQHE